MGDKHPQVIEAAGGLVWRETPQGQEVALIHRPRYNDWTLPKGKRKKGESWQQTALREVREETGCEVSLLGFAGSIGYVVEGQPKVVLYWNMALQGACEPQVTDEFDQLLWLPLEKAVKKLDYEDERALLLQVTGEV